MPKAPAVPKKYFNGFWYRRDTLAQIVMELTGQKDEDDEAKLDALIEGLVKGNPTRYAIFASRLDEERARW